MDFEGLQAFQAAFDRSRGFADLPFSQAAQGQVRPDMLRRMEYALLALVSEVGEVASLLKKANRRRLVVPDAMPDQSAIGEELADVLSYLLKFAEAAELDPIRSYLEKMALNAHRFAAASRPATAAVSLCGPPGSGKTTIAAALAGGTRPVYVEQFEKNPHLGNLQAPKASFDSDASQRWFLDEVTQFLQSTNADSAILDQDPTAIVLVYSALLKDRGSLSRKHYLDHLNALLFIEIERADILAGRRIILLDAPAITLASRSIGKLEGELDVGFLEHLRERFRNVFAGVHNVTFVRTDRPLDEVIAEIRTETTVLPSR